ncbi:MAG: glycosyl transferase family 4 [Candidatus Pacearchaeota archaeon]|nr:glycosyl transferase family 4 [Candidatus Pacearchaeota archaeon]
MIEKLLLIMPIIVSFFVAWFLLPYWIRKMKEVGIVWEDMNKVAKKDISGSGGVIVVLAFVLGVLGFVAYRIFYLNTSNNFLLEIFSLLTVILLLGWIGFIDDLMGWRKGGLSIRSRIILVFLASIPLVVINVGKSIVSIPFIGPVEFGLLYPLILIPLGIVGAATTFNFLAGFNGLEAGQGIILLLSMGLVAFFTGSSWLFIIALCMAAALIGFLYFNFYPTKLFPGDSLTYPVGGLIAIIAILGNFEKIAVFFFIPFIIETCLKIRGGLIRSSFGKPMEDGTLGLRYNKIYSLNHLTIYLMKKLEIKPTEKKAVLWIWMFQIIIIILGFIIFNRGIFG